MSLRPALVGLHADPRDDRNRERDAAERGNVREPPDLLPLLAPGATEAQHERDDRGHGDAEEPHAADPDQRVR
jgi:hypothetical protein